MNRLSLERWSFLLHTWEDRLKSACEASCVDELLIAIFSSAMGVWTQNPMQGALVAVMSAMLQWLLNNRRIPLPF